MHRAGASLCTSCISSAHSFVVYLSCSWNESEGKGHEDAVREQGGCFAPFFITLLPNWLTALQVTRVEDYGVFVEFQANGRTFTALLPGDEAKVRAAGFGVVGASSCSAQLTSCLQCERKEPSGV